MRSVLTTLGIIIGIVTVTLMGTAIDGLNRAFHKAFPVIGADVLYVQPDRLDDQLRAVAGARHRSARHHLEQAREVEKEMTMAPAWRRW